MPINNHNKTKKQDIASDQVDVLEMKKQIKKLTLRLWAGIFAVFVIMAAGVLMFTSVYYEQIAQALTGNYGKATGDLLTASDWNNLASDFVDKSGDTMSGDLTVSGTVSGTIISGTLRGNIDIQTRVIECMGNCNDEGTPNNICSSAYGASYRALSVDCEDVEISGADQSWNRTMNNNLDWCIDGSGEDMTVTCYRFQ